MHYNRSPYAVKTTCNYVLTLPVLILAEFRWKCRDNVFLVMSQRYALFAAECGELKKMKGVHCFGSYACNILAPISLLGRSRVEKFDVETIPFGMRIIFEGKWIMKFYALSVPHWPILQLYLRLIKSTVSSAKIVPILL